MEIQEQYNLCKEFMINHIKTVDIPDLPNSERVYRIEHSIRVAKYAMQIAQREGYDIQLCTLAAILHDVGKFEADTNKDHGRVSAKIAKQFLSTLDLNYKKVNDICYCISCHCDKRDDYNYGPIPEEKVIRDADSVDRFGVYRIIQSLHYSKFDDMSLHEKVDFCKNKISALENYITSDRETITGTKLFHDKCKIQLEYFKMLKDELEFTIKDISF